MEGAIRKLVTIGLGSAMALTCIVFAIPLKTVPYQTVETYYATEMKQESYVTDEPYVVKELCEKAETLFDGFSYSVPAGINISLSIDKPNAQLAASFELPAPGGLYIYSSSGHIIYERLGKQGAFEISLPEGEYRVLLHESLIWGEQAYMRLTVKWTELEEVTKYKEATRYREVPVQVEKQRTVTKHKKASIWELIFDG